MIDAKPAVLGGREVVVSELSVEQLDQFLLQDPKKYESTTLDRLLNDKLVSGALLAQACGMSEEELRKHKPSEIRQVADVFQEVNPDFFEMARRDVEEARRLAEAVNSIGLQSEQLSGQTSAD